MNKNTGHLLLAVLAVGVGLLASGCKPKATKSEFSKTVTFKTAENAPEGFDAWSFLWKLSSYDPDGHLEYIVTQPDSKEYYKWVAKPEHGTMRGGKSDFAPGFAGGDPSIFYGKEIRITFQVTKGDLAFDPDPNLYSFKFYKGGHKGTVVKTIGAVMESR